MPNRHARAALVAVGAAGLIATGVTAAAASSSGGGTATTTITAATDGAEAFTACVRSHGMPGFPGVTVSDRHVKLSGDVDVFSEKYRKAAKACGHLLPKGTALPGTPKRPEVSPPSVPTCDGDDCPPRPAAPDVPTPGKRN